MSNSKYGNKYNDDFWNKKLAEEGYKFITISSFDDSFYRKRMGRISWTDVCKNYGYDISGNITSKQKSA